MQPSIHIYLFLYLSSFQFIYIFISLLSIYEGARPHYCLFLSSSQSVYPAIFLFRCLSVCPSLPLSLPPNSQRLAGNSSFDVFYPETRNLSGRTCVASREASSHAATPDLSKPHHWETAEFAFHTHKLSPQGCE